MDELGTQKLSDCIDEIRKYPKISEFDEAETKMKIVTRILDALGWNVFSEEVKLEHAVGKQKVDLALRIKSENHVFIEVKKPKENLANPKHQEQLLVYANKQGVDSSILTNGIKWWFYLSLKPVNWEKRRFCIVDILENEVAETVKLLLELLAKDSVISGKAMETAELIWAGRQRNQALKDSLPKAWNGILMDPDSLLVDLLEEMVEKICGIKPNKDESRAFIRNQHKAGSFPSSTKQLAASKEEPQKALKPKQVDSNSWVNPETKIETPYLIVDGNQFKYRFSKDILVIVANWLIDRGYLVPTECPFNVAKSNKRFLVNLSPKHPGENEFYSAVELKNGLFIETHASSEILIEQAKRLLQRYGYPKGCLKVFAK